MDNIEWIVQRTLSDEAENEVTIALGAPKQSQSSEWICPFRIEGLLTDHPADQVRYAHGSDGLHALLLAIDGIYRTLAASAKHLTWSESEPGDTGIPRFAPLAWGIWFRHHVERMIDNEESFFMEGLQRKRSKPTP